MFRLTILCCLIVARIGYSKKIYYASDDCDDTRIVGGELARLGEFDYQASLLQRGNDGIFMHICGATVVSTDAVLTAAHCVVNNGTIANSTDLQVMAGHVNILDEVYGQIKNVYEIIVPPEYNAGTSYYDIAILKIKEPFKGKYISTIPIEEDHTPTNQMCTVSGWGYTNALNHSIEVETCLHYVDIPIVDIKECKKIWANSKVIPDGHICAGTEGKDSCLGDSGGPLVCQNRLVGVVSFGDEKCGSSVPGAYTSVAYFSEWIKENIKNSEFSYKPSFVIIFVIVTFINFVNFNLNQ